ncbi:hypothetical protein CC80DRAFT_191194 [Byssothecium circinans]|uniref:Uncharacterized protein n=1 Tax=Byssothecium circinans TaxID=147558 RepID=A0A6A5TH33_9PLEO|nr:hypothetical protein CC80DRAFT_191194 [Byssothecium circinans]
MKMTPPRLKNRQNAPYTIDDFGRPVYSNGLIGFRLPYFDQLIWNGNAARRCYIDPQEGNIADCRYWSIPRGASVAGLRSDEPVKASYTSRPAQISSTSLSATAPPRTTEIPSTSLFDIEAVAVETGTQTMPSPTPSSAQSAGSRGNAGARFSVVMMAVVVHGVCVAARFTYLIL